MRVSSVTKVSIIIPTYRDWDRLALCLAALQKQTCNQQDFEIIVVNNDAAQSAPQSLILPPNAQLLTESAPGSYAARNAGLAVAKGDIVGFTDSDCLPEPDWISNAIAAFEADTEAARVTGPVNLHRVQNSSWLAFEIDKISSFKQEQNVRNGVSVTANLFVKKALFERVGLFNANLMSGGDFEWNQRATAMGYAINFNESVIVQHPARSSMAEVIRKFRRVAAGGFAKSLLQKNCIIFILRVLVPPLKTGFRMIANKEPFLRVILLMTVLWLLKLVMLVEIMRVAVGGRPVR